jgi:hypothetical protein
MSDEAGNFDFSTGTGATKFFVITTVTLDPATVGSAIGRLRYELAWRGTRLDAIFHATMDPQAVRDEVFARLTPLPLRVDATIFEYEGLHYTRFSLGASSRELPGVERWLLSKRWRQCLNC